MATTIIWGGKDASWQPTITRHSPAGAGQARKQATAGAAGGSEWTQEQIRVRCAKLAHLARPTEVSTCAAMALEKTYQLKISVIFLAESRRALPQIMCTAYRPEKSAAFSWRCTQGWLVLIAHYCKSQEHMIQYIRINWVVSRYCNRDTVVWIIVTCHKSRRPLWTSWM